MHSAALPAKPSRPIPLASAPIHRPREIALVIFLFVLLVVLKALDVRAYKFDSDEPQHLHVVWGWAHGLVQYRDLFDNHAPLFQMLCAPLFALFPERADIVNVMRWFMFPLCALTLLFTAWSARRLVSGSAGLWAALMTLALPGFFFTSEEFRTDALWAVFWMLSLWTLLQRPFTMRWAFFFGLALGATFATSMKTTMLAISLGGGALALLLTRRSGSLELTAALRKIAATLGGLIIIPGALVIYFASQHALSQMYYGVIQHNMLHGLGTSRKPLSHAIRFSIHAAVLSSLGFWYWRRSAKTEADRLLLFVFGIAAMMFCLLFNVWPVVTSQDYLPFFPLIGILMAVITARLAAFRLPVQIAIVLVGLVFIVRAHSPFGDETSSSNTWRAAALRLVHPGERIMDAKGETIYRDRSIYYVLELLTLKRLAAGIIPDDIPERLIATGTCVVNPARLHGKDAEFVLRNYLPVDDGLRVAGTFLAAPEAQKPVHFKTVIPTRYAVVEPAGNFTGALDGQPYRGPLNLAPGDHTLTSAEAVPRLAVVWSGAIERDFSPFRLKRRKKPGKNELSE